MSNRDKKADKDKDKLIRKLREAKTKKLEDGVRKFQ